MSVHGSGEMGPLGEEDRERSNSVQGLVQHPRKPSPEAVARLGIPPKRIVQFWDDLGRLPHDVSERMESWKRLESAGFEVQVFDEACLYPLFIRSLRWPDRARRI
jgi:hypothetical protein